MKQKYKSIKKLSKLLNEYAVEHEFTELFNGGHVVVYLSDGSRISVIEHDFSMGRNEDLLEILGGATKSEWKQEQGCIGYLTVEDVLDRILYCVKNNTNVYISEGE